MLAHVQTVPSSDFDHDLEEIVVIANVSLQHHSEAQSYRGELLLTNQRIAFTCDAHPEKCFIFPLGKTSDVATKTDRTPTVSFNTPRGTYIVKFKGTWYRLSGTKPGHLLV